MSFEIAVHAAGTDHLVTVSSAGVSRDMAVRLAAGTSPAVAAAPAVVGGYEVAYAAAGSADLATFIGYNIQGR